MVIEWSASSSCRVRVRARGLDKWVTRPSFDSRLLAESRATVTESYVYRCTRCGKYHLAKSPPPMLPETDEDLYPISILPERVAARIEISVSVDPAKWVAFNDGDIAVSAIREDVRTHVIDLLEQDPTLVKADGAIRLVGTSRRREPDDS